MASNTKILVVGKTHDGQVPVTDVSDAFRDAYVTSTCFPKILYGRTENHNKVQQLFLGKYVTQIRTALLNNTLT